MESTIKIRPIGELIPQLDRKRAEWTPLWNNYKRKSAKREFRVFLLFRSYAESVAPLVFGGSHQFRHVPSSSLQLIRLPEEEQQQRKARTNFLRRKNRMYHSIGFSSSVIFSSFFFLFLLLRFCSRSFASGFLAPLLASGAFSVNFPIWFWNLAISSTLLVCVVYWMTCLYSVFILE